MAFSLITKFLSPLIKKNTNEEHFCGQSKIKHALKGDFFVWYLLQKERELNKELFGNLPFLPMEDHKKLFQETGIDIDGNNCVSFLSTGSHLQWVQLEWTSAKTSMFPRAKI